MIRLFEKLLSIFRSRFLRLTLFLLFVSGTAVAGFTGWVFFADGPDKNETRIAVSRGAPLPLIARHLEEQGHIHNRYIFRIGVMLLGKSGSLQAGEFDIPRSASMYEVMNLLHGGQVILHTLTIPEGLSVVQVVELLAQNELLTGDITHPPREGSLLPETYSFPRGESRDALLSRMQIAMQRKLADLWPERDVNLPFQTPEEAVVLASIVEKETGLAGERAEVAAVFINRLRLRMKLQSDPTIIYGLTGGKPLGRPIRLSEINGTTDYNTYVIRGLPPTPIANPGAASLAAVLQPAQSDALYFVADGTGGHVFARTLEEHNKNVRRWRRIRNRQ